MSFESQVLLDETSLDSLQREDFTDNPSDQKVFDIHVHADSNMFSVFQILLNTAIGSGTLMVPYCYTTGVATSILTSIFFCVIGYFTLTFMVDASYYCKKYDYRGLFSHTFGENRKWIVNIMIFLVQCGACMIYAHWNGRLLNYAFSLKGPILGSNAFWSFLVITFVVFPLTIFRTIDRLEHIAVIGTGFLFLLIVHAAYWFFKGLSTDGFDPERRLSWFNPSWALISLISVNSMAFNCHINLFPCLEHLKNCTMKRARILCGITVGTAFVLYNLFGMFTYFFLFDKIKGSALEEYDRKNVFTMITIIGTNFVLISSSPLVVWAARNSINNIIWKNEATNLRWVMIGGTICLGAALLANSSENVIVFFDVVGGLFTPLIIFFMPAVFFLKNQRGEPIWKVGLAYFIAGFTLVAVVCCTIKSVREVIDAFKK